jgi:hypothetical protein
MATDGNGRCTTTILVDDCATVEPLSLADDARSQRKRGDSNRYLRHYSNRAALSTDFRSDTIPIPTTAQ